MSRMLVITKVLPCLHKNHGNLILLHVHSIVSFRENYRFNVEKYAHLIYRNTKVHRKKLKQNMIYKSLLVKHFIIGLFRFYIILIFFLKIYGAAVSFFEVLPEEQLTEERKKALRIHDDEVRGFWLL